MKILLILSIFFFIFTFAQVDHTKSVELTDKNSHEYNDNVLIEFNRNGGASPWLEELVQWKNSRAYNLAIAKLNVDQYPEIQNSFDSSPQAPFPHYALFFNNKAVSFVGSADFDTVRDFVDNFIKKNSQQAAQNPPANQQDASTTQNTATQANPQATTDETTQTGHAEQITTDDQTNAVDDQTNAADDQTNAVDETNAVDDQNQDYYTQGEFEYHVQFNSETGQYEYTFPDVVVSDEQGNFEEPLTEDFQDDSNGTLSEEQHADNATHTPETETNAATNETQVEAGHNEEVNHVEGIPQTIDATETQGEVVDELNVAILDNNNFDLRISEGIWFIEFYAPWCGHCKQLTPTWAQLGNLFQDDPQVVIGKIDATENDEIAQRFGVDGYPTLLLLRDGQVYDYDGERDLDSLLSFVDEGYKNATGNPIPKKATAELDERDVAVLTNANFATSVSNGVWLVDFYAPWCGHCKRLAPIWAQIATELKSSNINVAKVNVDAESDLSSLYNVEYLPTVVLIADKKLYKYDGERDREPLIEFARGGYKNSNSTNLPNSDLDESDVIVLTDANYKDQISTGTWFIEFYAPWCGFCKKMKPTWAQLATHYKGNSNVRIAMSDATASPELAEKFGVESYPTIYLFKDGKKYPFAGNRTVEYFTQFVESEWKEVEHKALPLDASNIEDTDVIVLDDKNLPSSISKGEWLIEFYAPWCGFCKNLKPIYSNLATYVKNKLDSKFNVAKVDVDQNGKMASIFGIRYLPTIFYIKNGRLYKNNRGRSFDEILKFATESVNDPETLSFPMPIFQEDPQFDEKDVTVLTDANIDEQFKSKKYWLVEFYAPWCGHCKRLAPIWAQLATFVKEKMSADFGIAKTDATENKKLLEKFDDVNGYPTIHFVDTEKNIYVDYEEGRSIPEFYEFLKEGKDKIVQDKVKKLYASLAEKEKARADGVQELTGANFYDSVSSGIWFVEFYAPWCGFCKKLAPEFAKVDKTVKAEFDSKYHVAKVNVDSEKELGEHFKIEYLPTVLVMTEGKTYQLESAGLATYDTLIKFLREDYLTANKTNTFVRKEIKKAPAPTPSAPSPSPSQPVGDVSEEDVVVLGNADFVPTGKISKGTWFVEFYAPWCGFCKQLIPTWAQLAKDFKAEGGDIHIAKVDATVNEDAAAIFNVPGYPTLLVIENGKSTEYLGGRELDEMKKFIKGIYKSQTLTPFKYLDGTVTAKEDAPAGTDDESDVVVLKDTNFFSKIAQGTWIVDFYAPWCGHCKVLAPKWNQLAKELKGKINVGKVDITTEERLSEAFGPKYLPTIYLIKDGFYYKFDGKREVPDLANFAQVTYKKFDAKKLPPSFISVEEASSEYLITLNDENFFPQISKGEWFIEFYAPWCGFCKKLAPIYTQFSFDAHTNIPSLSVAQVDAEENSVATSFDVRGYPTLIFIKDGKYYTFDGLRTVEGMSEFVKGGYQKVAGVAVPQPTKVQANKKESRERKVFTKKVGNFQQLEDKNFNKLTSTGNWLITVNVPYDGFSKQLNNVLADISESSFNIKLSIGSVDAVKFPSLASSLGITKFPSLVLIRDGNQYVLDPSVNTLAKIKEFVESKYKTATSTKRNTKHDEL